MIANTMNGSKRHGHDSAMGHHDVSVAVRHGLSAPPPSRGRVRMYVLVVVSQAEAP